MNGCAVRSRVWRLPRRLRQRGGLTRSSIYFLIVQILFRVLVWLVRGAARQLFKLARPIFVIRVCVVKLW